MGVFERSCLECFECLSTLTESWILTFAGKDASAEFDVIHPSDVVGVTGNGKAKEVKGVTRLQFGSVGRAEDEGLGRHAKSKFGERSILRERWSLFGATRHPRDLGYHLCAVFLFFLIVVLAVGNHHVFKGPDDLNGYGYFYVRLYSEEYVLSSALLHIFVGLKRTWDQKLLLWPSLARSHSRS